MRFKVDVKPLREITPEYTHWDHSDRGDHGEAHGNVGRRVRDLGKHPYRRREHADQDAVLSKAAPGSLRSHERTQSDQDQRDDLKDDKIPILELTHLSGIPWRSEDGDDVAKADDDVTDSAEQSPGNDGPQPDISQSVLLGTCRANGCE